ncbi:heme peroxidase [Rhizodiscina lignyota]|uniref:Peroxidase n=1 Tax=Rhizodiscina lignyota TaxID=1504668 RepID=A0A9P4IMD5_9PEZI|nr:heme peroxidase [Rhizodiscina lignyota]
MATVARNFTRSAFRSTPSTFRTTAARRTFVNVPRQTLRQSFRRGFADEAAPKAAKADIILGVGFVTALAGGYYVYMINNATGANDKAGASGNFQPTFEDYQKVYNTIAKALEENDDYDDGSYGPVLLRLGWHSSGTYDKETGTGGSNGATMRFDPESEHGANAGLKVARDFCEPIKQQYPWISYGDLWTLGAVCAIQEMQGPIIPWRPGRQDRDVSFCTPDGRLPDAAQEQKHVRNIFYRMGFNDQEITALIGAHALGRCHADRSGFDGPWTFSPTVVTNDFYNLLLNEKWAWRKWDGPKQYEDVKTKSLMMLPADMAFVKDKKFREYVGKYAKDNDLWFKDFSAAVTKLFELGVPFTSGEESRMRFKPTIES